MNGVSSTWKIAFGSALAIVLVVVLAFATAAQGTGTDDAIEIAKLKRDVAALQTAAKEHRSMQSQLGVVAVSSRIAFIDAAGIHGMEGAFPTAGLTTRNIGTLQNVLAVTSKLAWPSALADDAREFKVQLRKALQAYQAGNKDEAFTALKAAHTAYHALVASGYQWLN